MGSYGYGKMDGYPMVALCRPVGLRPLQQGASMVNVFASVMATFSLNQTQGMQMATAAKIQTKGWKVMTFFGRVGRSHICIIWIMLKSSHRKKRVIAACYLSNENYFHNETYDPTLHLVSLLTLFPCRSWKKNKNARRNIFLCKINATRWRF